MSDTLDARIKELAAKYLPEKVAARGLEIHRVGQGLVRHARL